MFLKNDQPVRDMIGKLSELDVRSVVEIGPGQGILTFALLDAGMKVTAVEKDSRFADQLQWTAKTKKLSSLDVVQGDILKFRMDEWLARQSDASLALVGNIPYQISSPILAWGLPHLQRLKCIILMVQWEFAERMAAEPGGKEFGSLSVFVQLRSKAEILCRVKKEDFRPVPQVDSAIVLLTPIEQRFSAEQLQRAEKLTRHVFTQRRKKLRNSVKPFLRGRPEDGSPINLERRPETLNPEDFVALSQFLFD